MKGGGEGKEEKNESFVFCKDLLRIFWHIFSLIRGIVKNFDVLFIYLFIFLEFVITISFGEIRNRFSLRKYNNLRII